MRIEILVPPREVDFRSGIAAAGIVSPCGRERFPPKVAPRPQIAVSDDGGSWFLINASPDLRTQIERTPALQPRSAIRDSPIAGVLLTSGDIDQIAGLLFLRELQFFRIYCTSSLRRILQEDNSVFGMVNRIPRQVRWIDIQPGDSFPLLTMSGDESGICCDIFSLGASILSMFRQSVPPRLSRRRLQWP